MRITGPQNHLLGPGAHKPQTLSGTIFRVVQSCLTIRQVLWIDVAAPYCVLSELMHGLRAARFWCNSGVSFLDERSTAVIQLAFCALSSRIVVVTCSLLDLPVVPLLRRTCLFVCSKLSFSRVLGRNLWVRIPLE